MNSTQYKQLLGFLLFSSTTALLLFFFMAYQTDTPSFVQAIELWLGKSTTPDRLFRLSKPLALLIPTGLHLFLDLPIIYGLLLQQLVAYWIGAIILYNILSQLLESHQLALISVVAYLLCQPLSVYGLAMLTDGLGWTWSLIAVSLAVSTLQSNPPSLAKLGLLGLFFGLGLFIKESILLAGMFAFFLILIHQEYTWKQKVYFYFIIGNTFIATFLLGSYLVYYCFGQSLFQWINFGHSDPPPFLLVNFIKQAYHTLDTYWILILIGSINFIMTKNKSQPLTAMLLTAISSWLLLPFFWPYLYDRILFMIVPYMIFMIGFSIQSLGNNAYLLVLLGGITNVLSTFLIYKYQIPYLITINFIVFGILCLVLFLKNKKARL